MVDTTIRAKESMVRGVTEHYRVFRESLVSAIENSIACGKVLTFAKSQCQHGEWLPFLAECGIPGSTASELMRMYNHRELLREKSATTWSEARRIVKESRSPNRYCVSDLTGNGELLRWIWGKCDKVIDEDFVSFVESQPADEQQVFIVWVLSEIGLANGFVQAESA